MINKIQEELEDIVGMINTLHHCREIDDDILKEVDLFNLRYSKLALQTEKIFVSAPSFMELRGKSDTGYVAPYSNTRNVDRSMRISKDLNAESPKDRANNNKSFSGYENEARPYMKDTFNSKISKNLSSKKLETIEQNKATTKSIRKSPKKSNAFNNVDPEWVDSLINQFSVDEDNKRHQKLSVLKQKPSSRAGSPSAKFSSIPKSNSQTVRKTSFDFPPATDVVRREMQSLKNLYLELKEKLDNHFHSEFETQIDKIRGENAKILADNKVIQKDNSELMHTLFNIRKELKELREENSVLKKELSKIKSSNGASHHHGHGHSHAHTHSHSNLPTQQSHSQFTQISQTSHAPHGTHSIPTEEVHNRPSIRSGRKEQKTEEEDNRRQSSRYLISSKKSAPVEAGDSEELLASWVKRRLEQ